MERTILPQQAFYEVDNLILEENDAWNKLKGFISEDLIKEIKQNKDTDFKEALFKSLYSLYERIMTSKSSNKNIQERIKSAFDRAKNKVSKMKQDRINCIVAIDALGCIGKDNKLPFKQSLDLQHVKELTTDNIIILGNNTFKEIGVLPNREIRVITKDCNLKSDNPNVYYYTDYLSALKREENDEREIFIFGGEKIYELYFPYITDFYITFIETIINGDTYFPEIPIMRLESRESKRFKADENNQFEMNICHLRKTGSQKLELKLNKNKKTLH